MQCRRCNGRGWVQLRHKKPGFESRYTGELVAEGEGWTHHTGSGYHHNPPGPWCVYPARRCPICYGSGVEREKVNMLAWRRIHLDSEGRPVSNQAIT